MKSEARELWQSRYEQLRRQVLEPDATLTQDRWGLSLLVRKGMAGWMHAWNDPSTLAPPSIPESVSLGSVPALWQQQATVLLANMALSQYPKLSPCPV